MLKYNYLCFQLLEGTSLMRFNFKDNIHMRASILFTLVKLGICPVWTLCSLVQHCFPYMRHGKRYNTLFLLSETEKENTKTMLKLLPTFSSCVQLIHFVGLKQQLCSHTEQSSHIHHHSTLLFVVCHWLQTLFLEKQMKTKYFALLGFQH